ncbi:MAG: putative membrane protein [Kiritimatiellia bacterium]|jgi:uncharacterized membrane protein
MNPPSWIYNLVPPRRRPVTVTSLLLPGFFLILFIGLCIGLEQTDTLLFARPTAFWLGLFLPWMWWLHHNGYHGLAPFRAHFALLVRLLIAGAFVMVLAEPRAVRKSDIVSTMYVLDISDSIGEGATDAALKFVMNQVEKKPEKDQAGLVVFGRNAAVELPPRVNFPFEAINVRVAKDGTDLARGLSLAEAMLPDENQGHIVLISDGAETDGNVQEMLDALRSKDIPVDVLPISYEYENEVWLEKLEIPRSVKIGETYEASVVLSSLKKGAGKLVIQENDQVIYDRQVEFKAGKNRFVIPIYLREPGYYEYAARIEMPEGKDGWSENNLAVNELFLKGEGKVLFVTSTVGQPRDWEPMAKALQESKKLVEVIPSAEFPMDAIALMPYDVIVFPNVPADELNVAQQQAVKDAVFRQGIGFIMLGGDNSFGPGGYHRTPIEEVLPVSMDVKQKKIMPKGALAIVLHTCEFANGNTWGKRITIEAIKVLGAQDDVGVMVYNWGNGGAGGIDGVQWLFPLMPASELDKMIPKINSAQIGDMPSFAPTMEMGLKALKANDAAMKHMIIISDGDPSPAPDAVLKGFIKEGISITTISVFPHGGQEQLLMKTIANLTGGRYYYPKHAQQLPSIFIKEAKTLKRSMIQNKTLDPIREFPSPILKGMDAIPQLHGYVITSLKPRANNVLLHQYDEEEDPILAVHRHGLGKTAAFTSDLNANWGRDWVSWEHYRAFVDQLITEVARVQQHTELSMQSFADGNTGVVVIEDYHEGASFLDFDVEINGPSRRPEKVRMKQVGPRLYRGEFPLEGKGRYQVLAAGSGGDRNEQIMGGFAVPYSPEYLKFRADSISLKRIAEKTNGRVLSGTESPESFYATKRSPRLSSRPIFDWFLWALAFLIPLDVGVRRIQLDLYVIKGWLGLNKKAGESTETMGALLKRKQDVSQSLDERRGERPATIVLPDKTAAKRPKVERKPAAAKPKASEVSIDETTTTGRLLALKKRREEEEREGS